MARRSYAPLISSPLNPNTRPVRNPQLVMLQRQWRRERQRRVSVSPAERLLRHKAAAAWQVHVLLRGQHAVETATTPETRGEPTREIQTRGGEEEPPAPPATQDGKRDDDVQYVFHMPEFNFWTPQRVVRAMGLVRALPCSRLQQRQHKRKES